MSSIRLAVPYESQRDNASGNGYRECFTSSAGMLARFWGKVHGDDAYNKVRARFGDTTSGLAQVRALKSLGLKAGFWTNGRQEDLVNELMGGRPVAVGWLHHGPVTVPSGGGHWSVIVGLEGKGFFRMHDPYGEPMLVTGGHSSNSGNGVICSWANFLPRWTVEGPRSGWYLSCSR